MWSKHFRSHPQIGQAWKGKHIIFLHCTANNQFLKLYKSLHAPIEPARPNCAETLSQLVSIGYRIHATNVISANEIQYVLILE